MQREAIVLITGANGEVGHGLIEYFSAQADALAGVETLEAYTEWMKGLFHPIPNASYEVRSFAVDEDRGHVVAFGVFKGTHTGEGGPVPPTGRRPAA